ncbi:MAG: D-alanyl-D-alanine carboxypeptidase/D-alanyl-D-alanine-endopeptidase, partial [Bdellovibrionales bacterium]|nr:D-alanyl-D-alanine carboxypeptidase/D-alanyl-D-alanine-endopeptidase [Bdellovibrionales bacterium]
MKVRNLILTILLFSSLGLKAKIPPINFIVMDEKTTIIKSNNNPIILASITKLLTSYFALNILGPNFKFQTKLFYSGKIKGNILYGDLILQGGGDPLLSRHQIFNMALQLKKLNIKSIQGNFYFDDSHLYSSHQISSIGMGDQTYNPGISALSVDFNRMTIIKKDNHFYPSSHPLSNIKIQSTNSNFVVGKKFNYKLTSKNFEFWEYSKKQFYKMKEEIPIKNPSLVTASLFKLFCDQEQIQLPEPIKKQNINYRKLAPIYTHKSIPLKDIIKLALEYSNNLIAELVILKTARKLSRIPLTLKESSNLMIQWYKEKFKNLNFNNTKLINGSGITPLNTIPIKLLIKLLPNIFNFEINNIFFKSLLPISGFNSSIKRRLNHKLLAQNIYAKTGSLDYVNNIAGYIITQSKRKLYFVASVIDHAKRNKI